MNFSGTCGKMQLRVTKIIAWHSLQTVHFLKDILRVKAWICFLLLFFLNETSILVFAELAIFHYI